MSDNDFDFANSVVFILIEDTLDVVGQRTAGTGFLVSDDGLIATCAHVVEASQAEEFVHLIFPNLEKREMRRAKRVPEYWKDTAEEDIAILQLESPPPKGAKSLPVITYLVSQEETYESFGFPAVKSEDGLRAICRYIGLGTKDVTPDRETSPKSISLLQFSSPQISLGFSGAPIWDKKRRAVIGMVTEIIGMETVKTARGQEIRIPSDPGGRQLETTFATPAKTVLAVCQKLQRPDKCPYRDHLHPFSEGDAGFFFGRQSVVDDAISRLRLDNRFLAVFGPSGSGKSSLVQAGLIPRLRDGAVNDSEQWEIIVARPGNDPFEQLKNQGLTGISQDLSVNAKEWFHRHPQHTHLVLIIDHFEELLIPDICPERLCHDFIRQMTELLSTSSLVSFIIVMRNDFYPQLVQYNELKEWLERNKRLLNIPRTLKREDVIAIVEKPASIVGLRFENGLAEEIVSTVMDVDTSRTVPNDGQSSSDEKRAARTTLLPLLEFALAQLWKKRKDGQLTHADYEAIGGVTGSLNQWANEVFSSFTAEQKNKAKRILTDLVYLADQQQIVSASRRQRPLHMLYRHDQEQEEINQIITALVNKRLLVASEHPQSHETIVEIIHDALLWEWEDLRKQLKDNRSYLLWRQGFERHVNEWVETDVEFPDRRDVYKLIGGTDLQKALHYQQEHAEDLDQEQRAFIQVSQQRQKLQRIRVRRRNAIELIVASIVAAAGANYEFQQWQASLSHYSNIIAYQGHKRHSVYAVIWQHDAKRIASASKDVQVWYSGSAQHIYTYSNHKDVVLCLAWSPDNFRIASGSLDTTAQVWIADGQGADKPSPYIFRGHQRPIHAITWSPDVSQALIASGGEDTTVLVWNPDQDKLITTYTYHKGPVMAVAWSPNGRYIASGSGTKTVLDNTVHVWEPYTKQQIQIYRGHQIYKGQTKNPSAHVLALTWSPDNQYIASADWTGQIHVWSTKDSHLFTLYTGHQDPVAAVSWSPDGKYIASASRDTTVHVWDPFTGKRIVTYREHSKGLYTVAWSPIRSDKRIVSSGTDGQVREWQIVV